jgi:hypothetical protein
MTARKPVEETKPLPTRQQVAEYAQQLLASGQSTTIIPDYLTQEDLADWYLAKEEFSRAQSKERLLRAKIFKHYFPKPEEGTNNVRLPDGAKLTGKYPITRKVDAALLDAVKRLTVGDAKDQLTALGVAIPTQVDPATPLSTFLNMQVDKLIKYDPDLVIKEYRTLTAEQMYFFDQCMEIKPGSVSLEITPAV